MDQSSHEVRNNYARLSYCYATASNISCLLTIINHLLTNTYKTQLRFRRPTLYPIELQALKCLICCNIATYYTYCQVLFGISQISPEHL